MDKRDTQDLSKTPYSDLGKKYLPDLSQSMRESHNKTIDEKLMSKNR
jgi:hypothetical protein